MTTEDIEALFRRGQFLTLNIVEGTAGTWQIGVRLRRETAKPGCKDEIYEIHRAPTLAGAIEKAVGIVSDLPDDLFA